MLRSHTTPNSRDPVLLSRAQASLEAALLEARSSPGGTVAVTLNPDALQGLLGLLPYALDDEERAYRRRQFIEGYVVSVRGGPQGRPQLYEV